MRTLGGANLLGACLVCCLASACADEDAVDAGGGASTVSTAGGSTAHTGGTGGTGATSSGGGGAGGGGAMPSCADPDASATPPVVFWPKPTRAHPDIPYRYTLAAYDPDGRDLCYELDGAPTGMTLDAQGNLAWSPTAADVASSPFVFEVTIRTSEGGFVTLPIELAVGAQPFVFVSPDGADDNDGSVTQPFATIERGLSELDPLGPLTVVIRGGTYATNWEWERDGVISPLRGKSFTETEPAEVVAYPDEQVLIDCQSGHGLYAFQTSYVLFRDIEVAGATSGERGGAIAQADHVVFQRVTVRDSDWSAASNCTGFLLAGEGLLVHRCDAHDNYDRIIGQGAPWNSSNYLVYTEGEPSSCTILESRSSGSVVGYKIKHGGPGTLALHRVYDESSSYGFGGADDGLTIRYSTFVANGQGIALGLTDPSEHVNAGDMVIEHNTVVDAASSSFSIQSSYPGAEVRVTRNVFRMSEALGPSEGDPKLYELWLYDDVPPESALESDRNCFHAPNDDQGFRVGELSVGYADWTARGHDAASAFGDPGFVGSGDYHLAPASPCRLADGVAGAWLDP